MAGDGGLSARPGEGGAVMGDRQASRPEGKGGIEEGRGRGEGGREKGRGKGRGKGREGQGEEREREREERS